MVKRPTRENDGSIVVKHRNYSSSFENDSNLRDAKRQKQLNYGLVPLDVSNADHIQPVSHSGILMNNLELEFRAISPTSLQERKMLDYSSEDKNACAFCHSSKISEVSPY